MRPNRLRRGYTLMEVTLSTVLLSAMVFAASVASHVALTATSDVTADDIAAGTERRTGDRLDDLLLSASLATLEGIPSGKGVTPEPMQPGTDYADVRFRRVTGFVGGAVAYEPPVTSASAKLARSVDQSGAGSLVLVDGQTTTTLMSDVDSVLFRLSGNKLSATITFGRHDTDAATSRTIDFVLRVP